MNPVVEKIVPKSDAVTGWPQWVRFTRTVLSLIVLLVLSVALDLWFRLQIVALYRKNKRRRSAAVNRLVRVWGRLCTAASKRTFPFEVDVRGTAPTAGRYLVVANHQSSTDPPILIAVLDRLNLKFVALEMLRYGKPAVSIAIRHGGFATVAKENLGVDMVELDRFGRNMEQHDGSPVIFPEGRRCEADGKLLPFHYAGIEAVRRSSGLPLLPVVLNTKHPSRTLKDYYHLVGARITVTILDPIPFDEVQRDPRATYQALEETIRRTVREIRAEEELSESNAANARTGS